jgi:hypothetical protein
MLTSTYLRPVAYHRDYTYRLLLTDETGIWYLWDGECSSLVEIDTTLARWISLRPEIHSLPGPSMWFDLSNLPVAEPHLHIMLGD